jgi:hypothetical protein
MRRPTGATLAILALLTAGCGAAEPEGVRVAQGERESPLRVMGCADLKGVPLDRGCDGVPGPRTALAQLVDDPRRPFAFRFPAGQKVELRYLRPGRKEERVSFVCPKGTGRCVSELRVPGPHAPAPPPGTSVLRLVVFSLPYRPATADVVLR